MSPAGDRYPRFRCEYRQCERGSPALGIRRIQVVCRDIFPPIPQFARPGSGNVGNAGNVSGREVSHIQNSGSGDVPRSPGLGTDRGSATGSKRLIVAMLLTPDDTSTRNLAGARRADDGIVGAGILRNSSSYCDVCASSAVPIRARPVSQTKDRYRARLVSHGHSGPLRWPVMTLRRPPVARHLTGLAGLGRQLRSGTITAELHATPLGGRQSILGAPRDHPALLFCDHRHDTQGWCWACPPQRNRRRPFRGQAGSVHPG